MIRRPATFFAALFAVAATNSFADTYIVGPGAGGGLTLCTHETLQEAVDAAAAHAGRDEIRLVSTSEGNAYTGQAVVINDPALTIRGGYEKCGIPVATGRTVLDGYGGLAAAVMKIEVACSPSSPASDIRLERLELISGDNEGDGGGLSIDLCGEVTVKNVRIANNRASVGGGIYVHGNGEASTRLLLGDEVQIENNYADLRGGGIAVDGSFLQLDGVNSVVRFNATVPKGTARRGRGGGLWIGGLDPARPSGAVIGSGGKDNIGVIGYNDAAEGGGLFIGPYSNVRMFTTDATRPVRIDLNKAEGGAAMSIRGPGAHVAMWESILRNNRAVKGGGAVMASDQATFSMASKSDGGAPDGTVACVPRSSCNYVAANSAFSGFSIGAHGAVALVSNDAVDAPTDIRFQSVNIQDNFGSSLFSDDCKTGACDATSRIEVRGSRMVGNSSTPRVLDASRRTTFVCAYSTIARLEDSPEPLFNSNGLVSLTRSIIWAPGHDVVGGQTPMQLHAFDLLVHDGADFPTSAFPATANIIVRDPRFVNAAGGDVHLLDGSPALDIASADGAPNRDLDDNARNVDLPDIVNLNGPVDLGAYEKGFGSDVIFAAGFE
ncbi:MAG: hypothetical protein ABI650_02615 [Dokdonella sp.]